jgi:FkbH-like protein
MKKNKLSINIISSFNHANFCGLLKNSKFYDWAINEANYNQVFQTLTNPREKIWKNKKDITLVWTTPESISPEFKKLLDRQPIKIKKIKEEVTSFCSTLKLIKKNSNIVIIPKWILREPIVNNIALAYSKQLGLEYNLSLMNYYLFEELGNEKNFHILNSSKWVENCGTAKAYNSKLWYLMKCPFSNDFFNEAISDITNLYASIKGLTKKLLVLDLDNTLWGGIVGEVGWKKLRIGGHDYLGEAFLDFQLKIKALKDQGIVLALASKNEKATAIDAINNHPEMVLSMNDFATYRINWEDKAKNISEMVNELNLGLQSVVFFDDSSFERERVRTILPEVFVPDLPKDPTEYSNFISKLHCFDSSFITDEDKQRSDLYKSEFKRTKLKNKYKSLSSWIDTLNLEVLIENITNKNSPRTLQLINKTNQMNLSTRRLTEKEFNTWVTKKNNFMWTIRAKDKFGDYGIIGILSITIKDKLAYLVDFIFSCRIVGRFIEDSTIQFLKEFASKHSLKKINGLYKKTKKNSLIYKFLQRLNIIKKNTNSFIIIPSKEKIKLPNIKITQPKFKRK